MFYKYLAFLTMAWLLGGAPLCLLAAVLVILKEFINELDTIFEHWATGRKGNQ